MNKLLIVLGLSFFLVACGDEKNIDSVDELVEMAKEQQAKFKEEDERAKKAMDMSKGARVYEITAPTFGDKKEE